MKFAIRPRPRLPRIIVPTLLVLSLLVIAAAVVAPRAAAQADVTGFWVLNVPTGDGIFMKTFFDLKQSGEQVTGSAWVRYHKLELASGSFRDGHLHLVLSPSPQRPELQATYDGALDGDQLNLKVAYPERPIEPAVGERSSQDAMAPPAPLPVPPLHDVKDNGLALAPQMGWNSWNKFKGRVDDVTVRGVADAMVSSGMRDAGYTYVNIDDTWEGPRDAQGNITGNLKFPNMKGLADYVHSKGLKIGLYSGPGPETCAGYPGSFGHEEQDAKTYAAWGFDYLKYDWCSAGRIYKDTDMQGVYQKMGDALLASGRPILFSLCQYGHDEVWKWGPQVGGNSWRTTGDISDNWKSMDKIGFSQFAIASYGQAGHWNDPDMLEVGNGGMTADEYRTHMSLWSLLAAPLLAGNDLRTMTDETKSILMNKEVIAIDQDPDAKPVKKISEQGSLVVAERSLMHETWAVGLFNRGDSTAKMSVTWKDLGLHGKLQVRDLWAHKDLGRIANEFSADVPRHGVVLISLSH